MAELIVETSENASEDFLKSHYYKTDYEHLKESYIEALKKINFSIISIDDNYLEIFAEAPHITVQAKIIEQNPKETSIDFHINCQYLFGKMKKALRFINYIYDYLEKEYELKGIGLHP